MVFSSKINLPSAFVLWLSSTEPIPLSSKTSTFRPKSLWQQRSLPLQNISKRPKFSPCCHSPSSQRVSVSPLSCCLWKSVPSLMELQRKFFSRPIACGSYYCMFTSFSFQSQSIVIHYCFCMIGEKKMQLLNIFLIVSVPRPSLIFMHCAWFSFAIDKCPSLETTPAKHPCSKMHVFSSLILYSCFQLAQKNLF